MGNGATDHDSARVSLQDGRTSPSATRLTNIFKLKRPLIVAPMAGGPSSAELVIASSEAGALGSVGAAYSPAGVIKSFCEKVKAGTSRPFAINLFVPAPEPKVSRGQLELAIRATREFRERFGLPAPFLRPPYEEDFERQFETVLEVRPAVLSFVFGLLPELT